MMKTILVKVGIGTLVAGSLLLVSLLPPAHAQNDAMSEGEDYRDLRTDVAAAA